MPGDRYRNHPFGAWPPPRRLWAVVVMMLVASIATAELMQSPARSAPAAATIAGDGAAARYRRGQTLFDETCSSCHGIGLSGVPGRGPSLKNSGPAQFDFYLRTGRMPLASPDDAPQRHRPFFGAADRAAIIAYAAAPGGLAIPQPNADAGDLAAGRVAFADHCAGCHTIVGAGGVVTGGTVPRLQVATPVDVAEAVRIGPYLMPKFSQRQIDDRTLDSIIRYVTWTRHPDNRGGWALGNVGPVPEGLIGWLLATAVLLLVARVLGRRTPEARR